MHKHTPANLNELNQSGKTITAAQREKHDCTCYHVNMKSEKI